MTSIIGEHARWHEKEGREERKRTICLPRAPTISSVRNRDEHSDGFHGRFLTIFVVSLWVFMVGGRGKGPFLNRVREEEFDSSPMTFLTSIRSRRWWKKTPSSIFFFCWAGFKAHMGGYYRNSSNMTGWGWKWESGWVRIKRWGWSKSRGWRWLECGEAMVICKYRDKPQWS